MHHPIQRPARERKKRKKNLGRGNKRQARVKKGLRGQRKRPLPREKGPRGPCDPLLNTEAKKVSRKAVSKRLRTMPPPWPSLGRRAGAMAWGYAAYDDGSAPSSSCEKKSRKTQQKGKTKTRERSDQKHPCRLASRERASEEYQENPKNARGPEWHPDKNARRKGRTAKTGEQTNAAGDKDKNKKKNTRCVWGCAL